MSVEEDKPTQSTPVQQTMTSPWHMSFVVAGRLDQAGTNPESAPVFRQRPKSR